MFQSLLSLYNPWWSNPEWRNEGVTREIFKSLYASIANKPYITVLKGTRQGGKTFLIKQCITSLIQSGTDPRTIYYFLLDDPELARYIEEQPNEFGNFLKNEAENRGKLYIFFDEFQKVPHITNLIKLFYEFEQKVKFILTGSSSLQISDKVSESLLGRTETFILHPFSFKEFLSQFIQNQPFTFPPDECTDQLCKFLLESKSHFNDLNDFYSRFQFAFENFRNPYLSRYLLTGGYPQAAMVSTIEEAFLRIKEIKQTFIEKDIISLLRVEKLREFDKLLSVLALQTGNPLNYHDLQTTVGIHYQNLMSFFNILESTYLWFLLPVFASNKITSIKKRPKAYFIDVGLRNFLASTFDQNQMMKEKGVIAENFVFSQLVKFNVQHLKGLGKLYFWRSPDGNELDFILEHGKNLIPIEVKFQTTGQLKINRGLQIFLKKEGIDFAIVFTDNTFELRKFNGISIYLIPLVMLAGI